MRWEGARRDVPLAGLSSAAPEGAPRRAAGDPGQKADDPASQMARNLARSLARGTNLPPPLSFDPGSDRIAFGSAGSGDRDWALHPLADTAGLHYRFRAGDTLRVTVGGGDRPVTLAEVRVEPRRPAFHLLTASLWFDAETGALVRATYRPSRAFNLEVDRPEDARDVPRLLRPVEVEVRYVTVDHGLFDFRWWIPRRFAFEGELRAGAVLRFPAVFEWTVSGLVVNEALDPGMVPERVPEGWTLEHVREEEDEEGRPVRRVTVVVPPASALADDPSISGVGERDVAAFRPDELRELERRVRSLAPAGGLLAPRLAWGLSGGMTRFNRVEGLSSGLAASVPAGRNLELGAEARLGAADLRPNGELSLARGSPGWEERLAVYRRLQPASEWGPGHSLSASLSTLLRGRERTPYFRAAGAELRVVRDGRRSDRDLRLFGEAHRSAERGTSLHLWRLVSGDTMALNPAADEGSWFGAAGRHRWQSGVDPSRVRIFSELHLEAAGGSSAYGRGRAGAGVGFPLGERWAGALEAAAGVAAGEPPVQRTFFPGGARGFRGIEVGERQGEAFWLARAELGTGFPGARVTLFGDLLRVGPRGEVFSSGRPELAVGSGFSFLDGLLRLDLVRIVRGPGRWRAVAYLDGLL